MRVQDSVSSTEVHNEEELRAAFGRLSSRKANEFWLSHGGKKYPAMTILVKGDSAALSYFIADDQPGFRSTGKVSGLDPDRFTTFFINTTEEHDVLNDAVVPFSQAVEAAAEFLRCGTLPSCIEWLEL